jgi:hypothetical protein
MINLRIEDKKHRFWLEYSLDKSNGILSFYLQNIFVDDAFRDNGLAKRMIYTVWRIIEIHKINYYIVKVISPIIESIITKYYKYNKITNYTYLITGILDPGYAESILSIFLPIFNSIEQYKKKNDTPHVPE